MWTYLTLFGIVVAVMVLGFLAMLLGVKIATTLYDRAVRRLARKPPPAGPARRDD